MGGLLSTTNKKTKGVDLNNLYGIKPYVEPKPNPLAQGAQSMQNSASSLSNALKTIPRPKKLAIESFIKDTFVSLEHFRQKANSGVVNAGSNFISGIDATMQKKVYEDNRLFAQIKDAKNKPKTATNAILPPAKAPMPTELQKATDKYNELAKKSTGFEKLMKADNDRLAAESAKMNTVTREVGDFVQGLSSFLPTLLLSRYSPVAGEAFFTTQSLGEGENMAKEQGQDAVDSYMYGSSYAALNLATMKLFNVIPTLSGSLSKGATQKLINAEINNISKQATKEIASQVFKGASVNVAQDTLMQVITPVLKGVVYGEIPRDNMQSELKNRFDFAKSQFPSLKDFGKNAIMSFATGGLISGITAPMQIDGIKKFASEYKKSSDNLNQQQTTYDALSKTYTAIESDIQTRRNNLSTLQEKIDTITAKAEQGQLNKIEASKQRTKLYDTMKTEALSLKKSKTDLDSTYAKLDSHVTKMNADIDTHSLLIDNINKAYETTVKAENEKSNNNETDYIESLSKQRDELTDKLYGQTDPPKELADEWHRIDNELTKAIDDYANKPKTTTKKTVEKPQELTPKETNMIKYVEGVEKQKAIETPKVKETSTKTESNPDISLGVFNKKQNITNTSHIDTNKKLSTHKEIIDKGKKALDVKTYTDHTNMMQKGTNNIMSVLRRSNLPKATKAKLLARYKTLGEYLVKSSGHYNKQADYIVAKSASNIDVFAHEAGHALDKRHDLVKVPAIADGINDFVLNGNTLNLNAYDKSVLGGEAIAEFMRTYVTEGASATKKVSPEFYRQVMEKLTPKEIKALDDMHAEFADFQNASSLEQTQAQMTTRLVAPKSDATLKEKAVEKIANIIEVTQDRKQMLDKIVGEAEKQGIKDGGNPYHDSVNTAHTSDIAKAVIDGDYIFKPNQDNPDAVDYILNDTGEKIQTMGAIKRDMLLEKDGLKPYEQIEGLNLYLKTMSDLDRANPRMGKTVIKDGKIVQENFSIKSSDKSVAQLESDLAEIKKKYPNAEKYANKYYEMDKAFKKEWLVIGDNKKTLATLDKWNKADPHYHPKNKQIDRKATFDHKKSGTSQNDSEFKVKKRVESTDLKEYNPVENIIAQQEQIVNWRIKANAKISLNKFYDIAFKGGMEGLQNFARRLTPKELESDLRLKLNDEGVNPDNIDMMVDELDAMYKKPDKMKGNEFFLLDEQGNKVYFETENKHSVRALSDMPSKLQGEALNLVGNAFSFTGSLFTSRNILWTPFLLTKAPWTSFRRSITNNIAKFIADIPKAGIGLLKNNDRAKLFKATGQAGEMGTHPVFKQGYQAKMIDRMTSLKEIDPKKYPKQYYTKLAKMIASEVLLTKSSQRIAVAVDTMLKFAEFNRALDAGQSVQQATFTAQSSGIHSGIKGTMANNPLFKLFYFASSFTGDLSNMTRRYLPEAVGGRKTERKLTAQTYAKLVATVLMPMLIAEFVHGGDPDYDDASAAEKERNIYLWKNADGTFAKVKIDPATDSGALMFIARRLTDTIKGEADAWDGWFRDLTTTFVPSSPLQILYELGTNKKQYNGAPIESKALEGNTVANRFTDKTSQLAKWASQAGLDNLNLSPQDIDYVLSSFTGNFGKVGKSVSDKTNPFNTLWETFKRQAISDPAYVSDITNRFYGYRTTLTQIRNDLKDKLEVKGVSAKEKMYVYSLYGQYESMAKRSTAIANQTKNMTDKAEIKKMQDKLRVDMRELIKKTEDTISKLKE